MSTNGRRPNGRFANGNPGGPGRPRKRRAPLADIPPKLRRCLLPQPLPVAHELPPDVVAELERQSEAARQLLEREAERMEPLLRQMVAEYDARMRELAADETAPADMRAFAASLCQPSGRPQASEHV